MADVDNWIVTGASKRGWTTWMVGVAECSNCVNVAAIVPLVPIEPNLLEGAHRQYMSYGGWTFAFNDYTEAGIMQWLDDDIFGSMEYLLDPLNYEDRLAKMPTFIVLSSDDEFMMFDWTSMYFDRLQGETKLLISPNSEHSLITAIPNVLTSATAFARSIASGHTEEDRPSFDYQKNDNSIIVTIPEGGTKPKNVYLRHAETFSSLRRDFRWATLASEDNKNCSLPWIPIPSEQEQELKASHNLEDSQKICG